MSRWGKDHWSLLGYVETLCVDAMGDVGKIDRSRMRCNGVEHPLLASQADFAWQRTWGTRLAGFFDFPQRNDAAAAEAQGLQLTQHDDWDCLDDLADAGMIEILSLANGGVRLLPDGVAMAARLRVHKQQGGMFATFVPSGASATAAFAADPALVV